jgi:hypothetical protein
MSKESGLYGGIGPEPLKVFIGYDPAETTAYHVLSHSIIRSASEPVQIVALALRSLDKFMWRERDPKQSTDFAFSRFLVPSMCNFQGYALFMDCDMLLRPGVNIASIFNHARWDKAVCVCKHDYTPATEKKMDGMGEDGGACVQTTYPMKNWSSVMLFNNARCRRLSAGYVNSATGLDLHQFKWLEDESEIGEIPLSWNWLVGEYPYNAEALNVHYTLGGPWLGREYTDVDYAQEWYEALDEMLQKQHQPARGRLIA